jgi:ABC-2 type transport system ATP-binding protein
MLAIDVNGLTKKFHKITAVDDLSFQVKQGEIFAFLGPNGAGKTTTIKILTTLLKPTSGTLVVNGFNPIKEKDKVRSSFGIVFQDPSLDSDLTAYENMEFHAIMYHLNKEVMKQRIEHLMKMMELWDRRNDLVKNFSGGMKRRLEIARGLTHHPKILFLDEPTLGLDPQTRNRIWEHIKGLNKKENMTVFFTTHYMEEAEEVSDSIAIIDHGKIIKQGSAKELKKATKTKTLEAAFLKLTGKSIREEGPSNSDKIRTYTRMWRR